MPLQTSGPLSLFNIQTEFGGSEPIGISEYYRGAGLVNSSTPAGTGSFQTEPLTPASDVQIPTSGTIQASHFYGTQAVIVGNSGVITAPVDNDTTGDFVDVTLPAGVDLIRFFLVGGGGGGGGNDAQPGGIGGGGSTVSGTINTSWAGPTNVNRTLRFFIGRGGREGRSNLPSNSSANPTHPGGHGYGMYGLTSGPWSAWMNTYAVSSDMIGGQYGLNNLRTARTIYFPHAGTYTFQFLSDDGFSIAVDGTVVANTSGNNDQTTNSNSTFALTSPLTKTVTLSAGPHKVRFNHSNISGPSGYAVRIVNNTTSTELWTTRYEYASQTAYPSGGSNGYSGSSGNSGYGGSGGSATMLSIINGAGTEYFIALAGGGGGGGGGGMSPVPSNVTQNANWATQGWTVSQAFPQRVAGGDGENMQNTNNGANDVGTGANDGAGGGAGGGGIVNDRLYVTIAGRAWIYSGLGGRVGRGINIGYDSWADGGESGKSAVTANATRYADVLHIPTTSRLPINPSNPSGLPGAVLTSLNSYGMGGTAAAPGTDGVAYVDWGVTNASVSAPSVSRASIRAAIIPYQITGAPVSATSTNRGHWATTLSGSKTLVLDAFGGGGNPGTEYTYSWTNVTGAAVISAPTSYRTTITMPDSISSGSVRCTISDGVNVTNATYTWEVVADDPPPPPSTCFPAGAKVLMADGSEKAIESVKAGDSVMSVNGTVLVKAIETPVLGPRKLLGFPDGHMWSEEHAHWTRDANDSQWWWAANADMWRAEAEAEVIGGLLDNSTMRTGDGFEFAHVDGWKSQTVSELPASYDMRLYLPLTDGAPIIVNGYLVGAGINEAGFDYTGINWDDARTKLMPKQTSSSAEVESKEPPAPYSATWAPEPIEWEHPVAP